MASSADARIDAAALRGRVAVVTGGSRGIGAAVASALGGHGARVIAVSRSGALPDDARAEASVEALAADISTEDGIAALARRAPSPDIVVHSAGAFALASLADTSVTEFDRMMAVNLRAAFLLARAFLPGMTRRRAGHFVSIGSVAGRVALAGNAAYAASKFGLRGLHAVLDVELRGSGVRVTLVEPSATSTALWDDIEGAGYDLPPRDAMLDAAAVADAVLYAVTRPEGVAIPNLLIGRG